MSEQVLYQCPECGYRELAGDDVALMICAYHAGADGEQSPVQMVQVWPPRWTPLSEDKPDPWVLKLALCNTGFWQAGYMDDNERWWDQRHILLGVIAWMDGPELPEEE